MSKKQKVSPQKDEVWKIEHGRKGPLTVRLLEDPATADTFFEAEIIEGRARYASGMCQHAQAMNGLGTPGDTITMRTTLVKFVERVSAHG